MKIYEGAGILKTLPSVTPNSGAFGSFILLHAGIKASPSNPDETDLTGDLNGNRAIDLYSDETTPAIAGSADNAITLESLDGNLLDFMSFSDNQPYFSTTLQSVYDRAASSNFWQPECLGEEACYGSGSIS